MLDSDARRDRYDSSVPRCRKNRWNQHLHSALTSMKSASGSMTIKFFFRAPGPASRGIGRSHGERERYTIRRRFERRVSHPYASPGEMLLPFAPG